jgi:hypothetical protein
MLIGGLIFYFFLIFSIGRNRGTFKSFAHFWNDQNDEISVSLLGGLLFLIWDDESLEAITWILTLFDKAPEEPLRMERFYYLIVGIVIEWIYEFMQIVPDMKEGIVNRLRKNK